MAHTHTVIDRALTLLLGAADDGAGEVGGEGTVGLQAVLENSTVKKKKPEAGSVGHINIPSSNWQECSNWCSSGNTRTIIFPAFLLTQANE